MEPSKSAYKIFYVEDHPIFAEFVTNLLLDSGRLEVVGVSADGSSAVEFIKQSKVDLLLLDLELADISGIEVISLVRQIDPSVRIVVFSGHRRERIVAECLKLGVTAFLDKTVDAKELIRTILRVLEGKPALSPFAADILRRMVQRSISFKAMSMRDYAVLRLLAGQVPIKTIAYDLGTSISTVYKTKDRILKRAGVANTPIALRELAEEFLFSHDYRDS